VLNLLRSVTAVEPDTRVHTYIIDHDVGFAPNPFHRVCTLAACKPKIRLAARLGDYIVGTGSRPSGREGHLIYWMRVDEILTFDEYWLDRRFQLKRPIMRGSRMLRYGDNIYHRENGSSAFTQEDSFHSEPNGILSLGNLERDTGTTEKVLLGREFAYWGGQGPKIPDEFSEFVHKTQGHKNRFAPKRVAAFVYWLLEMPDRGLVSDPRDWAR
jgi:Nucleotide modification associated domain 2